MIMKGNSDVIKSVMRLNAEMMTVKTTVTMMETQWEVPVTSPREAAIGLHCKRIYIWTKMIETTEMPIRTYSKMR